MGKFYIKTIIILSVIFFSLTCVFGATFTKFSSKFIKNFEDCDKFEETITSEFEGKIFNTKREILGWKNGMCKYRETISTNDGKYLLNCSFTDIQVEDLYKSMKSKSKETEKFELDSYAEQTDPKTGKIKYVVIGSTTIKGNKAYVTWAKYQNNPYFCKAQKL